MPSQIDWNKVAEILLEKGDLPATSEIIRFVLDVKPDDEYSAQELASLILKDYGLTNRVIRMANSCFYNPTGTEITTVSRAIVFLGFDFIREIALATSFLETVLSKTPKERRQVVFELLGRSYFSAFLARKMSPYLRLDYEEIFIFTLFHRLVRVLLAIHAPEAYEALKEIEKKSPLQARKRLFSLGEKLARKWSLPRPLTETLEGSPKIKDEGHLANFINHLDQACQVLIEEGNTKPLKILFEDLGLGEGLVADFVDDSYQAIKDLNSALAATLKEGRFRKKEEKAPPQEISSEEFFQKAVSEITALLASPDFNYQQVLLMVIESICRSLGCQNVFLGIISPRDKQLILRYGVGEETKALRQKPVPLTPLIREIFQKQVEWSGKVANIPEAKLWAQISPGADLLFSPLLVMGKPLGMIFALRERPFTLEENQKVATLRNLAILGIVQERQRKASH